MIVETFRTCAQWPNGMKFALSFYSETLVSDRLPILNLHSLFGALKYNIFEKLFKPIFSPASFQTIFKIWISQSFKQHQFFQFRFRFSWYCKDQRSMPKLPQMLDVGTSALLNKIVLEILVQKGWKIDFQLDSLWLQ